MCVCVCVCVYVCVCGCVGVCMWPCLGSCVYRGWYESRIGGDSCALVLNLYVCACVCSLSVVSQSTVVLFI